MTHLWIDPNQCESLAILVESVAASLLTQHPKAICLEVDISSSIPIPADPQKTQDLIQALVSNAIVEMHDGGDLMMTAVETAGGIELEIADSGCDLKERETHIPFAAAAIGAKIEWQNCPQGGVAATIKFPGEQRSMRRAA